MKFISLVKTEISWCARAFLALLLFRIILGMFLLHKHIFRLHTFYLFMDPLNSLTELLSHLHWAAPSRLLPASQSLDPFLPQSYWHWQDLYQYRLAGSQQTRQAAAQEGSSAHGWPCVPCSLAVRSKFCRCRSRTGSSRCVCPCVWRSCWLLGNPYRRSYTRVSLQHEMIWYAEWGNLWTESSFHRWGRCMRVWMSDVSCEQREQLCSRNVWDIGGMWTAWSTPHPRELSGELSKKLYGGSPFHTVGT